MFASILFAQAPFASVLRQEERVLNWIDQCAPFPLMFAAATPIDIWGIQASVADEWQDSSIEPIITVRCEDAT